MYIYFFKFEDYIKTNFYNLLTFIFNKYLTTFTHILLFKSVGSVCFFLLIFFIN